MLNSSWADRPSTTFVGDMIPCFECGGGEERETSKKPVTASCANHVQRTAYVGEKCQRRRRRHRVVNIIAMGRRRGDGGDGASERAVLVSECYRVMAPLTSRMRNTVSVFEWYCVRYRRCGLRARIASPVGRRHRPDRSTRAIAYGSRCSAGNDHTVSPANALTARDLTKFCGGSM